VRGDGPDLVLTGDGRPGHARPHAGALPGAATAELAVLPNASHLLLMNTAARCAGRQVLKFPDPNAAPTYMPIARATKLPLRGRGSSETFRTWPRTLLREGRQGSRSLSSSFSLNVLKPAP